MILHAQRMWFLTLAEESRECKCKGHLCMKDERPTLENGAKVCIDLLIIVEDFHEDKKDKKNSS